MLMYVISYLSFSPNVKFVQNIGQEAGWRPPCDAFADILPSQSKCNISLISPAIAGSSIPKGIVDAADRCRQNDLVQAV